MEYKNDKMISVYANRYFTEWTNTDLRIRFGEIMFVAPGQKTKKLIIEERVGVTMSWLRAKQLRDSLSELIEIYEKVNGELTDGQVISTESDDIIEPVRPVSE
jgi:hypothetical protein